MDKPAISGLTFLKSAACGICLPLLFTAGPAAAKVDATPAAGGAVGQVFNTIQPVTDAGLHGFFQLLGNQPIAFVLLALALGTLIGKFSFKTISLGSTAGTLLVGIVLSMIAEAVYGIPTRFQAFCRPSCCCCSCMPLG